MIPGNIKMVIQLFFFHLHSFDETNQALKITNGDTDTVAESTTGKKTEDTYIIEHFLKYNRAVSVLF